MWCGSEDALVGANRDFDKHLSQLGVDHQFERSEGDHSWKWWDLHIQRELEYILA